MPTPITLYATSATLGSGVISRVGHDITEILGSPDVVKYGTSARAWSPQQSSDGVDDASVTLKFAEQLYVETVNVVESYNPGALSTIEAYDSGRATWVTLWYLSATDAAAKTTQPSKVSKIGVLAPSDSCPSLFSTDTVRFTWRASLAAGPMEVDAIALVGTKDRASLGAAWVSGSTVAYTPPPTSQVPINQAYSDSFSYVIRDCQSTAVKVRGTMALSFQAGTLPLFTANTVMQQIVYAYSGVVLAAILAILATIIRYRDSVIIRSSNFPFCIITLLFHLPLPIGAIFFALQPKENAAYVCHLRPWCTSIGLLGVLAALVVKTQQLRSIFLNSKLHNRTIARKKLFLLISAIVGAQIILLLFYSGFPLTAPIIAEGTGNTANHNVWQCSATSGHSAIPSGTPSYITDSSYAAWLGVELSFVFTVLLVVCWMAFSVRGLPVAFNESQDYVNASSCMFFFIIIILPLQFLIDGDVNALILIRGVGQNLAACFLLAALFGPKLYYIFVGRANDKTMQQTTAVYHSKISSAITPMEETGFSNDNDHMDASLPASLGEASTRQRPTRLSSRGTGSNQAEVVSPPAGLTKMSSAIVMSRTPSQVLPTRPLVPAAPVITHHRGERSSPDGRDTQSSPQPQNVSIPTSEDATTDSAADEGAHPFAV